MDHPGVAHGREAETVATYLNPGTRNFQMSVNSAIFVDKSDMIMHLNTLVNTQQRFVSVSRPRRFGKTMAADMICAYYGRETDSRRLFEKRKLAGCAAVAMGDQLLQWDAYLGQFDVIRIVMTDFIRRDRTVDDALRVLRSRILSELEEEYPGTAYDPADFNYSLDRFSQRSGRQFVVVIDEWDALFRVWKNDQKGQTKYLDFLRDWLKDKPYIALAYMTGILPIKKYGEHSALNMFTEYSMMAPRQLAPYTGFTEQEVEALCRRYGMDYGEVRDWYDGYVVSDQIPTDQREAYREGRYSGHKISIYSPLSVVEAMTTGVIRNYWNKTETYEALAEHIRMDFDGLKAAVALLMDGGRIRIDSSTYQNDMTTIHSRDDVFSLLVHLGYLGFDDETSEVFIPNKEILDEFKTSTKDEAWSEAFSAFRTSQELVKATWAKDASTVAALLEKAHDRAVNKTYNDEAALSYAIQLAYYAARKYYTILPELDSGKGFADLAFLPSPKYPDIPALLIELKYAQKAETAMAQIRKREYPERLAHYRGKLLLVGINYDKDAPSSDPAFKHHTCVIEEA